MILDAPPFRILDIPPDPSFASTQSTVIYEAIAKTRQRHRNFGRWRYCIVPIDGDSLYLRIQIRRFRNGKPTWHVDDYLALKTVVNALGEDLVTALKTKTPFTYGFVSNRVLHGGVK